MTQVYWMRVSKHDECKTNYIYLQAQYGPWATSFWFSIKGKEDLIKWEPRISGKNYTGVRKSL